LGSATHSWGTVEVGFELSEEGATQMALTLSSSRGPRALQLALRLEF